MAGAALGIGPAEKADDKEAKKVDEAKEEKPKTCIEKIKIQQQLIKDSLEDIKKNLKNILLRFLKRILKHIFKIL